MADVFEEVDEMMKQERLQKIWQEYGNWIIAFIVLTIVFTGGLSAYRHWDKGVQEAQTQLYVTTIESEEFPQGALETAAELRPGLRVLLLLSAGTTAHNDDSFIEALKFYDAIKEDNAIQQDFRDLATVLSVQTTLSMPGITPDIDSLKQDLKTVWSKDDSPWKYHAHLEFAVINAHYNNDYTRARFHLQEISATQNVPASLIEKATALDHVYKIEQQQKTETGNSEG